MSCVVCELYGVQVRPAVGVIVVPYSVRHVCCGSHALLTGLNGFQPVVSTSDVRFGSNLV